jgi:Ca2+-binding EF-hand superfamily protein
VSLKATSEDLEALKELFIKLDINKDGILNTEEIEKGMGQMFEVLKGDPLEY